MSNKLKGLIRIFGDEYDRLVLVHNRDLKHKKDARRKTSYKDRTPLDKALQDILDEIQCMNQPLLNHERDIFLAEFDRTITGDKRAYTDREVKAITKFQR